MTKISKLIVIFEVFSLFLLIVLAFFAYPQADDFVFANSLNNLGWLGSQINWYKSWFGRFSSTMLIISGSYLDLRMLCKIFPVLTVAGYFFAFYLVLDKFFDNVPKKIRLVSATTMLFLYVCMMPSLSQEFFWFTGWATYAPAQIGILVFISKINSIQENKVFFLLILLGIFIIGSNEVAMLILLFLTFAALLKDYKNKRLWLLLAVFAAFSLIVVLSPGNAVRSPLFAGKSHELLFSLAASSGMLLTLVFLWILNPFLWIAMFMFVYLAERSYFKIRLPETKPVFVFLSLIFLMFLAPFTHFYSTGVPAPARTLNVSCLIFLFLVFYLVNLSKIRKFLFFIVQKRVIVFPVFVLWIAANLYLSAFELPEKRDMSFYLKNPLEALNWSVANYGQNNFYHVYDDLLSGRAADYRRTMLKREGQIKNYDGGLLCIEKPQAVPKSIFYKDFSVDPLKSENKGFAEYHNLEKVAVCGD